MDPLLHQGATYECDDCLDTGTRKIVDDEGTKIWVDCPYCDVAERRRLRVQAELNSERVRYRKALQEIAEKWPSGAGVVARAALDQEAS